MLETYKSADYAKTHSDDRVKCVTRSICPSLCADRLWCVQVSYNEDGKTVSAVGKLSKKGAA